VHAFLIARRDLRGQLRDRPAVAVGLLAPIVLTLLAVSALGRLTTAFDARFLVVDQGSGVVGDLLVKGVLADPRAHDTIHISQQTSVAAATRAVTRGKATAVFVIPADFTRSVAANAPSPIRLVLNPADPVGSALARAVAEQFSARVASAQLSTAVALRLGADSTLRPNDVALLASRQPPVIHLDDQLLGQGHHRSAAGYFAPSMAVVGLLVVVQMASRKLMEERRTGTFRRMLAQGVPVRQVLLGKAMAGTWVGMSTMLTTLVVAGALTGARWGNPLLTFGLCLATVLAFLSLATLITVIAESEEVASGLGVLGGTFLALVGGNFVPLSLAPGLLVRLSAFTPNGWALRGFSALQAGHAGVVDLLPAFGSLALFTVAFGGPALLLARWRLQ
jgi:ABC-2 type transport system permease protein